MLTKVAGLGKTCLPEALTFIVPTRSHSVPHPPNTLAIHELAFREPRPERFPRQSGLYRLDTRVLCSRTPSESFPHIVQCRFWRRYFGGLVETGKARETRRSFHTSISASPPKPLAPRQVLRGACSTRPGGNLIGR